MYSYSLAAAATIAILPSVLAQASAGTSTNSSTPGAAPPSVAPVDSTNTSTATSPSSSNSPPQSFPAPTVTSTTCGTAQQNFNQCVTKVAKDISNCPSSDNTCLCQTYANIAACYNACPDLAAQGDSYKQQSTTYCSAAGIKANTTATLNTTTSSISASPTPAASTPVNGRNTTSSTGSSSPASTFAAQSAAPSRLQSSILGSGAIVVAIALSVFA